MTLRALIVSLAALAGCTHPSTSPPPSTVTVAADSRGKPAAPVAVTAELSARSAHLVLRFEAPAEKVDVTVGGVDGLVVEGEGKLVARGGFAQGETRAFDVAFKPGPGASQLVVTVAGHFNGASRARVVAFGVGSGPAADDGAPVTTTNDGARVKVLPAATH